MARKKVDPSLINGLIKGAQGQEVTGGAKQTDDPAFPVFKMEIKDYLVYMPRTNVVAEEGKDEQMNVLSAFIHDYKGMGKYGRVRCIANLSGNDAFNALGYDGTCPFCDKMAEVWELYNEKYKAEAQNMGIDPGNKDDENLKAVRTRLLRERAIVNAEEYVTFPVVLIPLQDSKKKIPTADAAQNLEPVFVVWKKSKFDEKIMGALDNLQTAPSSPAGLFWFWKFTYEVKKGAQPSLRDAGKNAQYTPYDNPTEAWKKLIPACEEAAKEFTLAKAAEVVICDQWWYKEDLDKLSDSVVAETRKLLDVGKAQGFAVKQDQVAATSDVQGALNGFTPASTTSIGVGAPVGATAPATAQVGATAGAGAPPVTFGK